MGNTSRAVGVLFRQTRQRLHPKDVTDGGAIFADAFIAALRRGGKRRAPTTDPQVLAWRQRLYSAKWLAKPGVQETQSALRALNYRQGLAQQGRELRRAGRDPVKLAAKRAKWKALNPDKEKAAQRAYSKRRWQKGRSQQEKAARLARDARRRLAQGKPRRVIKHEAHVGVFLEWQRSQHRLHDAHVREFKSDPSRLYAWRYQHDLEFRLKELVRRQVRKKVDSKDRISDLIRAALRRDGQSGKVHDMLGWSIAELRDHLKGQLPAGISLMSLGANGFHIDHIIPKRFFDLTKLEGVRAYWSLENLRPLPAEENLRKGSKLEVDHVL